jgi:hypothetical protein
MRTALVAVVIVAMAVTSAGLWQTPTYEASAQVWVSWQQEGPWANSGGSGEQIQTLEYRELPPTQEIMHTIGTRRGDPTPGAKNGPRRTVG